MTSLQKLIARALRAIAERVGLATAQKPDQKSSVVGPWDPKKPTK